MWDGRSQCDKVAQRFHSEPVHVLAAERDVYAHGEFIGIGAAEIR